MTYTQIGTIENKLDSLTGEIIGAAIELHLKNLKVERQLQLPIVYKGMKLHCDYRIDLLVEGEVVIEIKSSKRVLGGPVFLSDPEKCK